MIKYKYALDLNNQIICIDDLVKSNERVKYKCIECNKELIARLGSIRKKHFAHHEEIVCSGETYLHKLGKQMFYDEYKYCLKNEIPFYIEYYQNVICNKFEGEFGYECKSGNRKNQFDLTKRFTNISIEKRDNDFIPDLTISSLDGKEKIFIEIAVTHQSSIEKKKSIYKIIELKVKKEEELNFIKSHILSLSNNNIEFINFNTKTVTNNNCLNKDCEIPFDCFIVYESGKCIMLTKPLPELSSHLGRNKSKIIFFEVSRANLTSYHDGDFTKFENSDDKFRKLVGRAYNKKIKVKNCFICRYHAVNTWEPYEPIIFCKFLKKFCISNEGSSCQYYRVDNKYLVE